MPATIYDYLELNNIPYAQLPDSEYKEKFKKYVEKIKDEGLEPVILTFNESCKFIVYAKDDCPDYYKHTFQSGDLRDKMMFIWMNLPL